MDEKCEDDEKVAKNRELLLQADTLAMLKSNGEPDHVAITKLQMLPKCKLSRKQEVMWSEQVVMQIRVP